MSNRVTIPVMVPETKEERRRSETRTSSGSVEDLKRTDILKRSFRSGPLGNFTVTSGPKKYESSKELGQEMEGLLKEMALFKNSRKRLMIWRPGNVHDERRRGVGSILGDLTIRSRGSHTE